MLAKAATVRAALQSHIYRLMALGVIGGPGRQVVCRTLLHVGELQAETVMIDKSGPIPPHWTNYQYLLVCHKKSEHPEFPSAFIAPILH
jgi:hypothetical protein